MVESKIKGIILDLDNTLYKYSSCHDYALNQVLLLIENNLKIDHNTSMQLYEKAKCKIKAQLNHTAASHHRLLYFQYLCEELAISPFKHAYDFYQHYWDKFLEVMQLGGGVITFLEFCKQNNLQVCILTDLTAEIQYRKINHLGIGKYVDCLVTSEEVLFDKPHPIMFYTALSKMQLQPSEVIMIGDSWSKDIQGAQNIGIKAIYFTSNADNLDNDVLYISNFIDLEQKLQ